MSEVEVLTHIDYLIDMARAAGSVHAKPARAELAALRARADDSITRDAIIALAGWALKQNPPLSIIAACDRALWWSDQVIDTNKGAE